MRIFRSPGEAAGDSTPADANPNPDVAAQNIVPDGQAGGEGGEPAVEETHEQILERVTKERDELTTKVTDMSTKFGKQSSQVSTAKQMYEAIENNTKSFIATIAKNKGIEIKFADEIKPDLAKVLETGTTDEQAAAIKASQSGGLSTEDRTALETLMEANIASKYEDYDNLTDDRQTLKIRVASGQMQENELYHLAAQGALLPIAAKEIGEKAVVAYQDGLNTKNNEQITNAGGNVTIAEKSETLFKNVLDQLKDVR